MRKNNKKSKPSLFKKIKKIIIILIIIDLVYLGSLWVLSGIWIPGAIPKSSFIKSYVSEQRDDESLPELRWNPVPIENIKARNLKPFVIAEDATFYVHYGFDLKALQHMIKESIEKKQFARGASTISQQTAKNLFLSPSRNLWRKWHEAVLTILLEVFLSKQRILEIYVNVAEFGPGIYGIDAASQAYFNRSAKNINATQSAELAASLPWPSKNNPATRTSAFQRHANRIAKRSIKEGVPGL